MMWVFIICHADWVLFVILSMDTVKLKKNIRKYAKLLETRYCDFSKSFGLSHLYLISSWILNRNILKNNQYIAEEARQTMYLLYAIREFEICVMAFKRKTGQIFNVTATTQGFNMRTNGKPIFPEQPRKFIYLKMGIWYFYLPLGPVI